MQKRCLGYGHEYDMYVVVELRTRCRIFSVVHYHIFSMGGRYDEDTTTKRGPVVRGAQETEIGRGGPRDWGRVSCAGDQGPR
jgi:hypothetical protein